MRKKDVVVFLLVAGLGLLTLDVLTLRHPGTWEIVLVVLGWVVYGAIGWSLRAALAKPPTLSPHAPGRRTLITIMVVAGMLMLTGLVIAVIDRNPTSALTSWTALVALGGMLPTTAAALRREKPPAKR